MMVRISVISLFWKRYKQVKCESSWWTCDEIADVCPQSAKHVPDSEKSWKSKYVSPDGRVSQYPPSNSSPSATLSGSSSASAGSSVTFELATTTAFSKVYWYVAGPGDSGLGSHIETDTGSSSSTTESFTYTFGSSDSGDYTVTAYIYNYSDSSVYQSSHTVSVSSSSSTTPSPTPSPPTPTPTLVMCSLCYTDYDPNSDSSRHTETFTCIRPGCGMTYTECTDWEGACLHSGSSRHARLY